MNYLKRSVENLDLVQVVRNSVPKYKPHKVYLKILRKCRIFLLPLLIAEGNNRVHME